MPRIVAACLYCLSFLCACFCSCPGATHSPADIDLLVFSQGFEKFTPERGLPAGTQTSRIRMAAETARLDLSKAFEAGKAYYGYDGRGDGSASDEQAMAYFTALGDAIRRVRDVTVAFANFEFPKGMHGAAPSIEDDNPGLKRLFARVSTFEEVTVRLRGRAFHATGEARRALVDAAITVSESFLSTARVHDDLWAQAVRERLQKR